MLKLKEEKLLYDTWDNWCLRKLKEIGRSSLMQWAEAMEYENSGSLSKVAERLTKAGKLNVKIGKSPRRNIYEVKKDVVFTEHYI